MNKTYVITDDFIKAHKDLTFKEVFPELFKKFTGWAKDDEFTKFMFYYKDDVQKFGFNTSGSWQEGGNINYSEDKNNRPATNEEVVKKLSTHAVKLGYKKGVKIKSKKSVLKIISDSFIVTDDFKVVVFTDIGSYKIFDDGKWAEIVEEEQTFKPGDRIEIGDDSFLISRYNTCIYLIRLKDGKALGPKFTVNNIDKITSEELHNYIGCDWSCDWSPIN